METSVLQGVIARLAGRSAIRARGLTVRASQHEYPGTTALGAVGIFLRGRSTAGARRRRAVFAAVSAVAGLATHPDAAVESLALLAGLGFVLRGALDIGLAIALRRAEYRS
jgi:hypothetical protein